jgi:hypothetical protein
LTRPPLQLFEKIDIAQSGTVQPEAWAVFLEKVHAEKGQKKIERGDRYFSTLMFTLRRGCGLVEETEDKVEEEAVAATAERTGPTDSDIAHAEYVYDLMASMGQDDGKLSLEEIVAAQGGGQLAVGTLVVTLAFLLLRLADSLSHPPCLV